MKSFAIGSLGRETGTKVPTIRYYESIGLMPKPARSDGRRRIYGPGDVRRLRFIRHARELGFEVTAIRQLLTMADQPDRPCGEVDAIARIHRDAIDSRLARLNALRAEVNRMIRQCAKGKIATCKVIEVLSDHDRCRHHKH